jgi:predicted HTH domain antitoxin
LEQGDGSKRARWRAPSDEGNLVTVTRRITIEVSDDILAGLGLSTQEFSNEARLLLSAKLYEMGRLSSGQAARLCGRERVEFLMDLPRLGVPVSNLRAEDADDEIRFADEA